MLKDPSVRRTRLTAPVRISATGKIEHRDSTVSENRSADAALDTDTQPQEPVRNRAALPNPAPADRAIADNANIDDEWPTVPLVALGSTKIERTAPSLADAVLTQDADLTDFFTSEEAAFFNDGDLLAEQETSLEYEPEPQLSTRIRDWLTRSLGKKS